MPETAQEVVDRLERWTKAASADELVTGMFQILCEPTAEQRIKRALIRTLALRLAVKVMEPGYLEE